MNNIFRNNDVRIKLNAGQVQILNPEKDKDFTLNLLARKAFFFAQIKVEWTR